MFHSQGSFSTELHAVLDAPGNCLHLVLTPGHRTGCTQLPALLSGLRYAPGAVVTDKAYKANVVLVAIANRHTELVITPKTSRKEPRAYDPNLYADRNEAERFFERLEEDKGFATRYNKTAISFLATAQLITALDWLR